MAIEPMLSKLEQVLNIFWNRNCSLDIFCDFLELTDKIESSSKEFTQSTLIYTKWINSSLTKSENGLGSPSILKFILDLTGILCQYEQKFLMLHKINATMRILNLLPKNYMELEYYKFSYVKMLVSHTKTDVGLQCLSNTIHIWKNVLYLIHNNESEYFTEQCVILFTSINLKITKMNKLFFLNYGQLFADKYIKVYKNISTQIIADTYIENYIINELGPFLDFLNKMNVSLCYMVKKGSDLNYLLELGRIIEFDKYMLKFLKSIKTPILTLKFSKSIVSAYFFEIFALSDFTYEEANVLVKKYIQNIIDIINLNIDRNFVQNVIELCDLGILYTKCMCITTEFKPLNYCDKPFVFETQLLFLQIIPLFHLGVKILQRAHLKNIVENDDLRKNFFEKVNKELHPMIIHTIYSFRNKVFQNINIEEHVQFSLEHIMKRIDIYSKSTAIYIFQTLVYIMQDIVVWLTENNNIDSNNREFTELLTMIMDLLVKLIEKYEINWTDCLEATKLFEIVIDFLKFPCLPSEFVVKGLQLIEICILKFMSPNLALLIDVNESEIKFLGKFLYSKLYDQNVDVKRSILQILLIVSEHAKYKYPYFQKFLLEFSIPELLLQVVFNEENHLCKICALKCIKKLIQIEDIWNISFYILNVQENFLQMLKIPMDSDILSEVVNVIILIYEQDYFSENQVTELYSAMSMIGVSEFNIQVCVNVIYFWEKVIMKLLHEQGMIDNVFPEVTFSKQLRKIVALNKVEVNKRLRKLMNTLSQIGCLNVLFEYIKYVWYKDIFVNSLRISKYLKNLLNEYDVQYENLSNVEENVTNFNVRLDKIYFFSTFTFLNDNSETSAIVSPEDFLRNVNNLSETQNIKCDPMNQFELLLEEILNQATF